jgi:transmembrane sensor
MNEAQRLDRAADWLQRLQGAPRDEALVAQWADWCQADPENLTAFEKIQSVWEALEVPPVATARPSQFVALAASLLIFAVATTWWAISRYGVDESALTTNVAEHGSQILADGSRVDLGARTRILTRYTDEERNVVVETGEAFFEVARDAKRPFIVRAGAVRVTAVGTAFGVRRSRDRTVVTVRDGLVRIVPETEANTGHQIQAGAGEQITFVESTHSLSLARVNPQGAAAWKDGILKFVNEPLSAVVADVNRYAQREIVIDDPTLRDRLYTGTVYRERIDDWLRALEEVFPLQAVPHGAEISLVQKK